MLPRKSTLDRVHRLKPEQQLAFMAACMERLVPNYLGFCAAERWGSSELVRAAADAIWSAVSGGAPDTVLLAEFMDKALELAPDSEEYAFILTGPAQNALAAVDLIAVVLVDGAPVDADAVAALPLAALDSYLQSACDPEIGIHAGDPNYHAWAESAPLVLREYSLQERHSQLLGERPFCSELAQLLRLESEREGICPFHRGLAPASRPKD